MTMSAADLAHMLGGKRAGRQWVARCPAHDDHDPSLLIFDGNSQVQVRCLAGCHPLDVIKVLVASGRWEKGVAEIGTQLRTPHDDAEAKRNAELALAIWDQGVDPHGTLAETYLWGRDLTLPEDCSTLRYHARCPRGHERCPALIAAMYPLEGSKPVAIQRVFFTDKGEKLGSMMLGPVGGACMKLTPHYATFSEDLLFCPRLYITEGIETALAVLQLGFKPVWAMGSAGAIERMPVLFGVGLLIICADNDPPGLSAAKICAMRWGKRAHICVPPIDGTDFADIVRQHDER